MQLVRRRDGSHQNQAVLYRLSASDRDCRSGPVVVREKDQSVRFAPARQSREKLPACQQSADKRYRWRHPPVVQCLEAWFQIAATDKQVTGRLTQSGQCSPFNSSNQRL